MRTCAVENTANKQRNLSPPRRLYLPTHKIITGQKRTMAPLPPQVEQYVEKADALLAKYPNLSQYGASDRWRRASAAAPAPRGS